MTNILDRKSKKITKEKIFGEKMLRFLYGDSFLSSILLYLVSRFSFVSSLYGLVQKTRFSRNKIASFIKAFSLDSQEFEKRVEEFSSFNDFFIRKLKKEARPIIQDPRVAILPADGRYLAYQKIPEEFFVKEHSFTLETFLQDRELSKKYENGSMVIARLCPADYHRFHFSFDCIPSTSAIIKGYWYSVHPIALKKTFSIFSENKRVLTLLSSSLFGAVACIEVGATNVATIHQTAKPNIPYKKGDEKGYFSFGGSTLVLLFEKDKILLDKDLVSATEKELEVRAFFGDSMGKKF